MAVVTFTQENFDQEVLKSSDIAIVDFWATWCGPCKMFSPIIDEIAEENHPGLKVGKVNEYPDPACIQGRQGCSDQRRRAEQEGRSGYGGKGQIAENGLR